MLFVDPQWYQILKWWLPIFGGGSIIVKAYMTAKKNIGEYFNTLMHNHLTHIQEATQTTVDETRKTNDLLASQALQGVKVAQHVEDVKVTLADHNEKEMQVWDSITKTMAVLEDRTRRSSRTPRPRRK